MLLNKCRASNQFIYGEPRKSWKLRQIQMNLVTNTREVQTTHFKLHPTNNVTISLSEYFNK